MSALPDHCEPLEALESAVRMADVRGALQAASDLMDQAVAEAQLDAAGTAIDSNLAKLDEIKVLEAKVERLREALCDLATAVSIGCGSRLTERDITLADKAWAARTLTDRLTSHGRLTGGSDPQGRAGASDERSPE